MPAATPPATAALVLISFKIWLKQPCRRQPQGGEDGKRWLNPNCQGTASPRKGGTASEPRAHSLRRSKASGATQPLLRPNIGWGVRKGREEAGKIPKKAE